MTTNAGSALWYLSRASGVVSLVLLTLVVVGGVLVRTGRSPRRALPRFVLLGLHRNVALVALVFLGLHVATVVLDQYVSIDAVAAVVPLTSGYRTAWVGLGTVAVDLLLAVVVTSLLRTRVGPRTWRAVHWCGYAVWPVAVAHGLGTGSDVAQPWLWAVTTGCAATVVAAVAYRLTEPKPSRIAAPAVAVTR
jgi:sulfoxide reductase heme-binding subunit YedZ